MSELLPILAAAGGLVTGALVVWFILRTKAAGAASEVRAEVQPALATLTERVNAKEQQIAQLQSTLAAEAEQKKQLAVQLQEESNKKVELAQKLRDMQAQQLEIEGLQQ